MENKPFLALVALLCGPVLYGQFALEQAYPNAGTPGSGNQFLLVDFESMGERYVYFNKAARTLTLFNLDHEQVQVIDMSAAQDNGVVAGRQVLYLTQHLFDLDDGIEFMYGVAGGPGQASATTYIMDESGAVIQAFPNEMGYVLTNYPQAHFPIYQTSAGAKMVLSHQATLEAKVYGLPGQLPSGMQSGEGSNTPMIDVRVFPNPGSEHVRFEVSGLSAVNGLTLRLYSSGGMLARTHSFSGFTLDMGCAGLPRGAYTYTVASGSIVWSAGTVLLE